VGERIACDPQFAKFQELNTLEARLNQIPRQHLDECVGVDPTDNSGTKIVVVNPTKSKELNREYNDTRNRIEEIHAEFKKFDPICQEAEKLGLKGLMLGLDLGFVPSVYGLERLRADVSNQHFKINRRKNNEAAYLLRGRATDASDVNKHKAIVPLTSQIGDLESRLKAIDSLINKAKKLTAAT
jgi:hypothetical protein